MPRYGVALRDDPETPQTSPWPVRAVAGSAFLLYAAVLVALELGGGQEALRPYVADVDGQFLTGVNTTASVSLVWAAALLFAVALWAHRRVVVHEDPGAVRRDRWFLATQVVVFAAVGVDDRFLVHERVAARLDIPDAPLLAAVGLLEIGLLVTIGRITTRPRDQVRPLVGAAVAFGLMVLIDGLAPADATGRLAAEEVTKVAGATLVAVFAWRVLAALLSALGGQPHQPGRPVDRRSRTDAPA